MLLIGVAASIVGVALTLWMDWFPEQGSTAADDIDTLYDILLIASVPVFVLVMTIAIYCVVRFRARPGDLSDGAPIHGNTRLEIIWVTIPFLMVSTLAIYGWIVLDDIEAKPESQQGQASELKVRVIAQQFAWRFEYPKERVRSNELVLPVNRPVDFDIESRDVIHSFWVPEFRLKSDAVPGLTTDIRVTPSRIDNYKVVCAELCGIGHSTMRQRVRVVSQGEFDDWLAERQRRAGGGGGDGQAAADGEAIFTEQGCGACHTFSRAGTTASVGPDLDRLAADARRFGRGQSPEEYVRDSIVDPDAVLVSGFPGNVMPKDFADQLSPEEIDALVQYLLGASR
jgi:cytochrome c oxidase subunit II